MDILGAWFLILIVTAVLWAFWRLFDLTLDLIDYWQRMRQPLRYRDGA